MDFIQSSNKQVDKFGAGKHGFSAGNPTGGVLATYLTNLWCDGLQQEVINVIEAGGLAPSGGDLTQLLKSIRKVATGRLLRTLRYTTVSGTQYVSVNGAAPTTVGAASYVPSAEMVFADVEAQGGGGAGGGANNPGAGQVSFGAPGASGSYARSIFLAATIGASVSISVGAGGAGFSAATGGTGTTTSFGALMTAPGGGGGSIQNGQTPPYALGSNAGTAAPSGGNLYMSTGAGGVPSMALTTGLTAFGGQGGGTPFGIAQPYASANTNGLTAIAYGAGGSGVAINAGFGPATGASGAPGVVIVREYA